MDSPDGLSWELEPSHFPAPLTRWTAEFFGRRQTAAIKDLCQKYGLVIDGVAFREFHGRAYTAIVPLGGKPRKPPPAFLVPLLCRVVPELRGRISRARAAERDDEMGRVMEEWLGAKEEAMLAEGRQLLHRPLDSASDADVAAALEAAADLAGRGIYQHFLLHAVGVLAIGSLGYELVNEHGWDKARFTELFTGLSDTSTGPAAAQAGIIGAVRAAGAASVLAEAKTLEDIRAIGPAVASAVDDYLATWGQRAIRYEIAYPTVAEKPEWLLRAVQEQARRPEDPNRAGQAQATRAARAAEAVAALGGDDAARDRVARAQQAFPIREGNETATVGVPVAALRRIGLVAGDRLRSSGRLERVDDVFDLTVDEVLAVLRGAPDAPAEPLALGRERRTARMARADELPPPLIGPPPPPAPDLRGFPADIAGNVRSLLWYTEQILGKPGLGQPAGSDGVAGEPAAPGTYDGPARIVHDEADFDRIEAGDVLVCPITSPVWSMVFPSVGALVCDAGGLMSHPAIIAREFGIPAVVGTGRATSTFRDGELVRVDGSAGTVVRVAVA